MSWLSVNWLIAATDEPVVRLTPQARITSSSLFLLMMPTVTSVDTRTPDVMRPATVADSNFAANLSSASDPHRLAVVVSHEPRFCRPRLPTTMRGRSSRRW